METKANRKDIIEIIAHVSKTRVETGHVKLWKQSQKSKQKRTGNESVWKNGKRSNERKRTNLKEQKWVWSGNPGGTCYCDVFFLFVFLKLNRKPPTPPTPPPNQDPSPKCKCPAPSNCLGFLLKGQDGRLPQLPSPSSSHAPNKTSFSLFHSHKPVGTCSKTVKVPVQLIT